MDETRQPGITLSQVYLESAFFEHRPGFLSLPAQAPPGALDIEAQLEYRLSEDRKGGAIRLTVLTNPNSDGYYRFKIVMGALLVVQAGAENMTIEEYVQTGAAALLHPFAREAVA